MKAYIFLFIFLLSFKGFSQQNDTQAALYNIGIGSLFGGIGAVINKKPQEKYDKVFIKSLYQGALGGAIVYGSKKMVYNFHENENFNMLWSAKLVNAVGISIIENAASNRYFWEKWHLNIGFNRIEMDVKNNYKVQYKVMPVALLLGTVAVLSKGKFSFKHSLITLTPVFLTDDSIASTYVNSIIINESFDRINRSLAHEFIHVFQYDDFMAINMVFNKKRNQWKNQYPIMKKWSNWIYMDLPSGSVLRSIYLLENINQDCYFDNFFENEANFYSNKHICR